MLIVQNRIVKEGRGNHSDVRDCQGCSGDVLQCLLVTQQPRAAPACLRMRLSLVPAEPPELSQLQKLLERRAAGWDTIF